MPAQSEKWHLLGRGVFEGALSAMAGVIVAIYVLNMLGLVAISFEETPLVQESLVWAYDNLRLSVIPFSLTLIVYIQSLRRLRYLLSHPDPDPNTVFTVEKWIDVSVSLFFGIGVIWTAIGMRSALLVALNGLDQGTAMQLGAFEILRRLVDGGILLALSTTIFGAVGGYFMRVVKVLLIGTALQRFRARLAQADSDRIYEILQRIEFILIKLAGNSAYESESAMNGDR